MPSSSFSLLKGLLKVLLGLVTPDDDPMEWLTSVIPGTDHQEANLFILQPRDDLF